MGVVLRPGAIGPLAQQCASEFADKEVDLADVWDVDVGGLLEELAAISDRMGVFGRLKRFLSNLVDHGRPPSRGVGQMAEQLNRGERVSVACDQLGMSYRRSVGNFRSEVGITPKLFSRLSRFEFAVAEVRRSGSPALATVAARAGYSDQSHMTRDFAEFAGRSPGSFHRDGANSPNHVDLG